MQVTRRRETLRLDTLRVSTLVVSLLGTLLLCGTPLLLDCPSCPVRLPNLKAGLADHGASSPLQVPEWNPARLWQSAVAEEAENRLQRLVSLSANETDYLAATRAARARSPGIPHAQIIISADSDFALQGWPGSGLSSDPYLIEGLDINCTDTEGYGIFISNTRAHFLVNDCLITRISAYHKCAVILSNVTNGCIAHSILVNHEYGVLITDASLQNRIANNTFEGCWTPVELSTLTANNTIVDNFAWEALYGIILYGSNGNTVANNSVWEGHYGISLYGSSGNTVANNTIAEVYWGIFLDGSDGNTLRNNTLDQCGFELHSSDLNVIADNSIHATYLPAMYLEFSNHNDLLNNTCATATEYAWLFASSVVLAKSGGNNIVDNSLLGAGLEISTWVTTTPADCRQGIVTGNRVNGQPLLLWQDQSGLDICTSAAQIVVVNCSDVTVHDSTITNSSFGILLFFSDGFTVVNNTLAGIGEHILKSTGIKLWESRAGDIRDNSVSHYQYGIVLNGGDGTRIEKNRCFADSRGIHVEESPNAFVGGNTIGPGEAEWSDLGIIVMDSPLVEISDNYCNVTSGEGIAILSCINPLVNGNICEHADWGVFLIEVEGGTFTNNTCRFNGIGMQLGAVNASVITFNTFQQNALYGLFIARGYDRSSYSNEVTQNLFEANLCGLGVYPGAERTTVTRNLFLENRHPETGIYFNAYDAGQATAYALNYWSDHQGYDHDGNGIGDEPYLIPGPAGARDSQPLMLRPGSSPIWLNAVPQVAVSQGAILVYDLDATAPPPGVTGWSLNDTAHFTISDSGVILCRGVLTVGTYGLRVQVQDDLGSTIETTLSVTILPVPLGQLALFPAILLVCGALAAVILIRGSRRTRKR